MTFTLLTLGAMIAMRGICAVAIQHSAETVDPVTPAAGEDATLVGLSDPAADTLSGDNRTLAPQVGWNVTTVTALYEAEQLLDCLERQGYQERELVLLGDAFFAVRWR